MCRVECVTAVIAFMLLCVMPPSATFNTISTGRKSDKSAPVSRTVTRVPVVAGGEAELPCATHTSKKNDSLMLVVWYRDETPVYSFDTREPESSAHWIEDEFIGRAHWHNTPAAGLRLQNVQPEDRDIYRCRVDFYVSQTINYLIALDVIELPSKPVIYDGQGKEITGTAGPYHEGGQFRLTCIVTGGYPVPRIQWLNGDVVLDTLSARQSVETKSRSLPLHIMNATRAHLNAVYTCTADNTMLAPIQKTTIKIDLYLKPLTVEIVSREQPLSVGRKSELICKTSGARPPAKLSWWLEGKEMDGIAEQTEVSEENMTESLLQWMPTKEHNGRTLYCKAEHPNFNHTNIESKLPLNIYYMPESTIHLGAQMNPNDIEEGDDVYFVCNVDANPPAYKVVWEHNGVQLQHNPANGVIVTGNTNMALRHVSRYQAGQYTCTASNVEGDGKSQSMRLEIVYRPICHMKEMLIKGAAMQEPTTVVCEVDAFPPPNTFEWILNSSAGSIKVNPDRFTVESSESKSVLTYTPVSDVDYGTLACRATNMAGQQVTPCVYTLLPVTRPDPPTNCTVYNLTDDSLDLLCVPGYDGGRQCVYMVEVWSPERLIVNATSGGALWNLRRLGRNRQLKMIVYAANERGRSEHFSFTIKTSLNLSPRRDTEDSWNLNWAAGIFVFVVATVGIILCLAFIVTKIRQKSSDYEVSLPTLKNQNVVVQKRNSPQGGDDKNPDLIPLSKELTEAPPDPPSYAAITAPKSTESARAHSLHRSLVPPAPGPRPAPSLAHYDMQLRTYSVLPNESRFYPYQGRGFFSDYGRGTINNGPRPPREIVTTRTPLLAAHQESCV